MRLVTLGLLAAGCPSKDPVDEPITDTGTVRDPNDQDGDGVRKDVDCDDGDPAVYPGAPEVCGDDRVTDCGQTSDDGLVTVVGGGTFTDLAEALGAAPDGAEVRICAGTWTGNFLATRPVHLVGHGGAAVTVLDGEQAGTVLTLVGGSTVTGLTLTGGAAPLGGGLHLVSSGTLVVTDAVLTGNTAELGGGVWLAADTVASFPGTSLAANRARYGGGLYASGAVLDLTGATIDDNTAEGGGGLYLVEPIVTGGRVTGNVSAPPGAYTQDPTGGGGIYVEGDSTFTGTEVSENEARGGGGAGMGAGVRAVEGLLTLVDVAVHDNLTEQGWGGGLHLFAVELVMEGTTSISANRAQAGGGILASSGSVTGGEVADNRSEEDGGGLLLLQMTSLRDVVVRGNHAAQVGGGGWVYEVSLVEGCTFESNTAASMGGLYASGVPGVQLVIDGSSFLANDAANDVGGLYVYSSNTRLVGSTIADNTAQSAAGLEAAYGRTELSSCTIVRNVASGAAGGLSRQGDAVVVSIDSDWGDGADDNVPSDVNDLSGYGSDASFTCTPTACTPAP